MNWFSSAKKLSGSPSIFERSSSGWMVKSTGKPDQQDLPCHQRPLRRSARSWGQWLLCRPVAASVWRWQPLPELGATGAVAPEIHWVRRTLPSEALHRFATLSTPSVACAAVRCWCRLPLPPAGPSLSPPQCCKRKNSKNFILWVYSTRGS